ncbi:hypothetical protein EBESD8_41900 [Rhodococcus aetherivorans]|nr:hypothetical protein EBESD8_41900 [Rhodococcus aetherivorans]
MGGAATTRAPRGRSRPGGEYPSGATAGRRRRCRASRPRFDEQEIAMMRVLTFAAGAAVGFVLGTRAGRDTYEKM